MWYNKGMENVKQWILENSEQKYKEFSEPLNCGRAMKGVRIPLMRQYCKQLVKSYGLDALELFTDDWFEEIMMQGFVIGYAKELIELKEAFIYNHLRKCDTWSLVDSFSATLKLKNIEKTIFYDIIKNWRQDDYDYVVRFTLVHCIDHYIDDEHIDDILEFSKTLNDRAYTVKMANAWLLSVAYINYPDKVLEVSKELDDETFKMTKGKIRDSFRVSKENKERFVR